MKKIGVLISSKRNNINQIQDAIDTGELDASIGLIVMSDPVVEVMEIAKSHDIQTLSISEELYMNPVLADEIITTQLKSTGCELVFVDNYTKQITTPIFETYPYATIACHHSILPAFAGERCVEATYNSGVKISGITFHFITDLLGEGPIISQEPLRLDPDWTFDELADSLQELASEHVVEIMRSYLNEKILISEDGQTRIVD